MRGYTRASALGPIADFVETRGGSIDRIFQRADLPVTLLNSPDQPPRNSDWAIPGILTVRPLDACATMFMSTPWL